jgi:prepilin-type N-terminal cleavage/methylation domain-containing protein
MRHAERRGFTLIELIAGLALAGVVFISMILLIDQLRDGRDRLLERARYDNRNANGAEFLRVLVARAEASGDSARRFLGSGDGAQFRSWCETPGAWLEPCAVQLFIERSADSSFVRAQLSTGEHVTLVSTRGDAAFRYFVAVAGETVWSATWRTGSTLPAAVALIADTDTLVMTAGGRG